MPAGDKVTSGDIIEPRAGLWNDMVDAANAHKRQRLGLARKPRPPKITSPDQVKVKNTISSTDLAAGSVVELGDFLLSDVRNGYLWFEGSTPSLSYGKHHAVLTHALEYDDIGLAQLGGVVAARVLVTNVDHRFALPTSGQTYFTSSPLGPYRLLAAPSSIESPTEHLLPVALNGGVLTLLADAEEAIASGASGTFDIVDGTPGSETSTGVSCEALNDGPDIGDGDRCSLSLINWRVYASLVECSE